MDVARELLRTLPEADLPLLVSAEEQTAGRGRMGRVWVAPAGSALLTSLALRPRWLAPERSVALVWMAAVALCEAVEVAAGVPAGLKWPNDLLLPAQGEGLAKAAGILLELSYAGAGLESAVIGIGVNVSAAPPPGSARYPATCVEAAAGRAVSRLALLQALLTRLDAWYTWLGAGDTAQLFAAWRGRLRNLGAPVRVETPAGPIEGLAEDVGDDGALLVRDAAGQLQRVSAGDVGML